MGESGFDVDSVHLPQLGLWQQLAQQDAAHCLQMVLDGHQLGDVRVLPLALRDLVSKAGQDGVQQERGTQVGRVVHVIGALRVVPEPGTLVGGVVQDNVADAQNLSRKFNLVEENNFGLYFGPSTPLPFCWSTFQYDPW